MDDFEGPLPDSLAEETRQSLQVWIDAGLGMPFIPDEFAAVTVPIGEWAWGRKPQKPGRGGMSAPPAAVEPFDAYMQFPEVERFEAGDWRPRFLLCHAGHGTNSYGINYVLVNTRIAVFAQALWGGVYTDRETSTRRVRDLTAELADLHRAAAQPPNWPRGRLLVRQSDFRRSDPPRWAAEPGIDPEPIKGIGEGIPGALAHLQRMPGD